jgi:hypothetical protein
MLGGSDMKYNYTEEGYKRIIEAQERAKETRRLQRLKIEKEYETNPTLCLKCHKSLPFIKRKAKFCSHSCSASYNNTGRLKNSKTLETGITKVFPNFYCAFCGKSRKKNTLKYCSLRCQANHRWMILKNEIEINQGFIGNGDHRKVIVKKYLIESRGHRCEICGITEWMGKPTPLVRDHIDGNHQNNALSNLRVICPNCDAQTPTYKNRNYGNGRHSRRDIPE